MLLGQAVAWEGNLYREFGLTLGIALLRDEDGRPFGLREPEKDSGFSNWP